MSHIINRRNFNKFSMLAGLGLIGTSAPSLAKSANSTVTIAVAGVHSRRHNDKLRFI